MNLHSAACSRDRGCTTAGVAAGDPVDRKVAERLIQRAGRLSFQSLVEPGLIFGYRQISLGERLTEVGDDLLPLTVADAHAEIGVGRGIVALSL